MHLPKLDLVEHERAELRHARDVADAVVVQPRFPKHHRSQPEFGDDGGAATFFSIVFVTADPNSAGGGNGGDGQAPATMGGAMEQSGEQTPTVFAPIPVQTFSSQAPQQQPTKQSTPKTVHTPTPTKHATQHTSFDAATQQTAAPTTNNVANGALATASPSASPSAEAQQQGMTTGAKAGIAVGVLLGLGILAGLAFFAFRMWKQKKEEAEDEKHNPFSDSSAAPPFAPAPAPAQRGFTPPPVAPMADFARPSTANTQTNPFTAPSANVSMRDLNQPLPAPPVNPFGNQAALASQSSFNGSIPIGDETANASPVTPLSQDSDKEIIGAAFGGAAAGMAIGGAAGAMSSQNRHNAPKALELDASRPAPPFANQGVPQSPAASAYSFTSQSGAVAAAAVAGAPPPPISNVHRVQLDFVPSMHDEMELKQGELVRMLHEYDDGWALCTKFDKSSRGVCPRTCLSQKPLQPRARNGPPPPRGPSGPSGLGGPGPRGPPPGRTASPAPSNRGPPRPQGPPSRSASPAPGPHPSMQNWPAKPTNASTITSNLSNWPAQPVNMIQRSMSPGPYGGGPQQQQPRPQGPIKRRSQSVGGGINMPKPLSMNSEEFPLPIQGTPAQSPVNRKPVPST